MATIIFGYWDQKCKASWTSGRKQLIEIYTCFEDYVMLSSPRGWDDMLGGFRCRSSGLPHADTDADVNADVSNGSSPTARVLDNGV